MNIKQATLLLDVYKRQVEENLHYVKFDETSYVLANSGLTDWTQSANPNTEDGVQYIAEKTAHSTMLGYAPNVAYSGFAYPSDTFNLWLYKVGKEETCLLYTSNTIRGLIYGDITGRAMILNFMNIQQQMSESSR